MDKLAIGAISLATRRDNRRRRATNKKGPASCQPLSSVALACVDARERIVLPLEAGSLHLLGLLLCLLRHLILLVRRIRRTDADVED